MLSFITNSKKSPEELFLSTKEAAQTVPYSREYIGRLAREKKVPAILVGRKWLVNLPALKNFYAQAKIEEDVLSERIRAERFVEQRVTEFLSAEQNRDKNFSSKYHLLCHVISASVTFVAGVIFFTSGMYFDTLPQVAQLPSFTQTSPLEDNAVSYEVIEVSTPIAMSNGIFLFSKDATSVPVDPAQLFSDDVNIVEGDHGVQYIRMWNGESFSDFPFVHLPSTQPSFREVIDTTAETQVF